MQERKSTIRLKHWDYSDDGWYFVTICVRHHECVFGDVVDSEMVLNDIGKMVERMWQGIPNHFKNVELDEFIVMPNHMHGIVVIDRADEFGIINKQDRGLACNAPTNNRYSCISPKSGSLSTIIRSFKSACTKNIRKYDQDFQWQRSFHDHIIQNDRALQKIRKYIHFNVEKWEDDIEHPNHFV